MGNYITGASNGTSAREIRTIGRAKPYRMGPDEKATKKVLGPDHWRQLEAVSRGTWVNHLGRGHARQSPQAEERQWEEKLAQTMMCGGDGCQFGRGPHAPDCRMIAESSCDQCRAGDYHVHLG